MNRQTLTMYTAAALFCAALCMALPTAALAGTVQIDLVPVGDAGNVPDPLTTYGAVSYAYSMGEYDTTMAQYTSFLNAVATSSDPYALYNTSMATATPTYGITRTSTSAGYCYALAGNSANVPVTYVSWGDAARFVNWLQNGEPTGPEGPGTTETGSYQLNGSTGSAALMAVTRGINADWVLPNVNEWYKAAYYAGGTSSSYWTYATQSNNVPSNVLSGTGTNNSNYTAALGQPPRLMSSDPVGWLTPVGSFADSPSAYGTYDETGDVWQWNESPYFGQWRGLRGGTFAGAYTTLASAVNDNTYPTVMGEDVGFRVAYVPEPGSLCLLFFAAASVFTFKFIASRKGSE